MNRDRYLLQACRFFGHGVTLRLGEPDDYPVLREVDDDAGTLFERAGLELNLPEGHEFLVAERERWQRCLAEGSAILASDERGHVLGFAAVCLLDAEPFLAQLSVRHEYMRRGIGGTLLRAALNSVDNPHTAMWLTTYDHLPWNRPFYERHGFARIAERDCGKGLRRELAIERRSLPLAERRVVMRRSVDRAESR